jgi:hypothetical protein
LVKHWPGIKNVLADVASRSFDMFHDGPNKGVPSSTNLVFLNLFALSFPLLSQQQSWHTVKIVPAALLLVILTLLGKPSTMQQWTQLPISSCGATGILHVRQRLPRPISPPQSPHTASPDHSGLCCPNPYRPVWTWATNCSRIGHISSTLGCPNLQAGWTPKPNPFLRHSPHTQQVQIILAFAAQTRTGLFGRGRQIAVGSVTSAVR